MGKGLLVIVFSSSFSILFYEVILLRIFSFKIDYHFASFVLGISIFGIVLGSLFLYFREKTDYDPKRIFYFLSSSFPISFFLFSQIPFDQMVLLWDSTQIFFLIISVFLLAVPFFSYGILISFFLRSLREISNLVYGCDLMGCALGAILAPQALRVLRPEVCLFLIFSTLSLLQLIWELKRGVRLRGFILVILPLIFAFYPLFREIKTSEYKSLNVALKMPGSQVLATLFSEDSRIDVLKGSFLRYAPGLSLNYRGEVPQGLALSVDGEISGVFFEESSVPEDFLTSLPSFTPYVLRKEPENVLIVGLRSGIDPLCAKVSRAKRIDIVERDRAIENFLALFFNEDSIYRQGFLRRSVRDFISDRKESYDVISLSRLSFSPSGSFGAKEDYETTCEALKSYIYALDKSGILFIQIFHLPPPRYELRLFKNLAYAAKSMGIEDLTSHLVIFKTWDTWGFILKKDGFKRRDILELLDYFSKLSFEVIFPSSISNRPDLTQIFELLILDEKDFERLYPFDIRPTTDDRPFFHYFLRLSKIGEILRATKKPYFYLVHEGLSLFFLFCFLFVLVLLFLGPATFLTKPKGRGFMILYFSTIGFAFMFFEVSLVHILILAYGSPTSSFSATLSQLLLGAGIGSMLSRRLKRIKLIFMVILFLLAQLSLLSFMKVSEIRYLLVLFGFPMGIFFPLGLWYFSSKEPKAIPFAYSINGAASVFASPFASILAISFGLHMVLTLSFFLYLAASALLALMLFPHPFPWSSIRVPPSRG